MRYPPHRREFVRGKIRDARRRYVEWAAKIAPKGAPSADWKAWHEWRLARLDYFDQQLQLRRPWNVNSNIDPD